jgi:hypothetical protein
VYLPDALHIACALLQLHIVKPGVIVQRVLSQLLLICEAALRQHHILDALPVHRECG